MYQKLWLQIAEADDVVVVNCSAGYAATLIQAVSKEKSITNNARAHLGLPRFGSLVVNQTPIEKTNKVKIEFRLRYNGDKL